MAADVVEGPEGALLVAYDRQWHLLHRRGDIGAGRCQLLGVGDDRPGTGEDVGALERENRRVGVEPAHGGRTHGEPLVFGVAQDVGGHAPYTGSLAGSGPPADVSSR